MIFLKQVAAMSGVPIKTTLIAVPPRGKNNVPFFQKEIDKIIENGCTNSDIEDYVENHPEINGKEIWDYVSELSAPKACKGCKYIELIGMGRCLSCVRQPDLQDYYEKREN